MQELASGAVWGALGAIIVANILLSGDNAVVIAMAARSLEPRQQRSAVFWGSAAAIVMRVVLTLVAVQLLQLPWLKIVGGALLLWIGVQLLREGAEGGDEITAHGTLAAAVRTILVADLVMSTDNVIAVAGAADKAPDSWRMILIVIGLATSIPLIIAGSQLLMKVMDRFPIIVTLGAALLGFLAGGMLVTDPATEGWFSARLPDAEMLVGVAGALLVVAVGKWMQRREAAAGAS